MPKNVLKADIRLMLNKLTTFIEDGDNRYYQGLVSSIYNELDSLNVVDLYATREYISDNLNKIIASNAIVSSDVKGKLEEDLSTKQYKVKLQKDANSEPVELYSGSEEDAKAVADKLKESGVIGNVIIAADGDATEDVKDNLDAEPDDEFNDIPSENAADDIDYNSEEPSDTADADDDAVVDDYDDVISKANDLLAIIDKGISEVIDLSSATDLAEIKSHIEDEIKALNDYDIKGNDFDVKELKNKIDKFESYLEDNETKAGDVINSSMPGQADTEVATKSHEKFGGIDGADEHDDADKNATESSVIIGDDDNIEGDNTATSPDEFNEDLPATEDNTVSENNNKENELTNFDKPSNDAPSGDDIRDALDDGNTNDAITPEPEQNSDTLADLLVKLTELVDVPGENAKEFADTVSKIEETGAVSAESTEPKLDDANLDDPDFDDIDKDIENNIVPETEDLPPQELVDIDNASEPNVNINDDADTNNDDAADARSEVAENAPKDDEVNVIEEKDEGASLNSSRIFASADKTAETSKTAIMAENEKKRLVRHATRVAKKNSSNKEDIRKDINDFCASKFPNKKFDSKTIDACVSEVIAEINKK